MKKIKLFLIGITTVLLVTSFVIADTQPTIHKTANTDDASLNVDVPIWEIGDSWTYRAEYWEGNQEGESITIFTGDLTLEVTDDTGDSYICSGEGRVLATKENFNYPIDQKPIIVTAGAEITFRKEDLGLERWHQWSYGIGLVTLNGVPLPIPVQFAFDKTTTFNPTWVITPFPLVDGLTGVFDSVEFIEEWIATWVWGLMTVAEGSGSWSPGEVVYTVTKETISCESGGYTGYNISGDLIKPGIHDYYRTYYVEEVGSAARESIHIDYTNGETYLDFNLELLSTTYEP